MPPVDYACDRPCTLLTPCVPEQRGFVNAVAREIAMRVRNVSGSDSVRGEVVGAKGGLSRAGKRFLTPFFSQA